MITMALVSERARLHIHKLFSLTDGSVFFWSQCYYNHQHNKSVASDLTFQPLQLHAKKVIQSLNAMKRSWVLHYLKDPSNHTDVLSKEKEISSCIES